MLNLIGYKIDKLIESNTFWTFYSASTVIDNSKVIIRLLNPRYTDIYQSDDLKKEFQLVSTFQFPANITLLTYDEEKNGFFVYMPFNAKSLETLLSLRPVTLTEFFAIALQLTEIIINIHSENILIRNLHPANILIDLNSIHIDLIGLHEAVDYREINASTAVIKEINDVNQIAYSSPEMTGRMDRKADIRTDLYALGVIFYEMLTQTLPFINKDISDLIYAHFTKIPKSPTVVNSQIPENLSNLILKLLSKMPEDRYQTANGLLFDLKKCAKDYSETGNIQDFILGSYDRKVSIEQTIYGRSGELNLLFNTYEKVRTGKVETLFISGPSGSGKTSLVNQLKIMTEENEGFFLSGKFDPFSKNTPFVPITQAFQTFVRKILSSGKKTIQEWNTLLISKLGEQVNVLTSFIPELEWIIGKQLPPDYLSSMESHTRFLLTFQSFIQVIAEKNPFVLFIDDIQWGDSATFDLLEYLIKAPELKNILFIFAFRNDKESGNIEFVKKLQTDMQESHRSYVHIPLTLLQKEDVQTWISKQYELSASQISDLSSYIYHVTFGNPFYINQLLQTFEFNRLVETHLSEKDKKINLEPMIQLNLNDNVLDYLMFIIKKQPDDLQVLLKIASCFGNELNLEDLSIVLGQASESVRTQLFKAVEEGFIIQKFSSLDQNEKGNLHFIFIHDKVQQALYQMMSTSEKEKNHLKIGQFYAQKLHTQADQSGIFNAVEHLNFSKSMLDEKERLQLSILNKEAGEKAKLASAFESALQYFHNARELLPKNAWIYHYPLTFQIYIGFGETAYLNRQFEISELAFNQLLEQGKTIEEKLEVYNLKIILYNYLFRVEEAVRTGIEALKLGGWKVSKNPHKFTILKELLLVKWGLTKKKNKHLLELPKIKEKQKRLMLQVINNMNGSAYHDDQNLSALLMLKAFSYTLKYGDTDISAIVYNNYALIQSAAFGNLDKSDEFGRLSIEHAKREGKKGILAQVYLVYGIFINQWKNHTQHNITYLQNSQQYSLDSGNLFLANAVSSFIPLIKLINGDSIENVLEEVKKQFKFVKRMDHKLSIEYLYEIEHWLQFLMDKDFKPNFDLPFFQDSSSNEIMHYTLRLQMVYLINEKDQAAQLIKKLEPLIDNTFRLVNAPEYYFYHTLWVCRFYREASRTKQRKYKKALMHDLKIMKKWAGYSPVNYQHKYLAMKAEISSILLLKRKNEEFFAQAIHLALKNGFVQDAAIISQSTAEFYYEKGLSRLGNIFMKDAYDLFHAWGAVRIAEKILEKYPTIIKEFSDINRKNKLPERMDVKAFVKVSQALSSEIKLEQLVRNMMQILMENAGAEKGFLLIKEKNDLQKVIKGSNQNGVSLLGNIELDALNNELAVELIHYVNTTLEPIVLEDAANKGLFTNEYYIKAYKPKSVLAFPILHQNRLIGVLYLENNLITHAFTQERIEILSLLASQAAISIQNAQIYSILEEKVKERTIDLEKANQQLEEEKKKRSELLSNISHDLKTPITSIQGYIEAILDGIVENPRQQKFYLERSLIRIKSLNRLILDLFDLSQLEMGSISFSFEAVTISKLFIHITGLFELDVKARGLEYQVSMPNLNELEFPLVFADPVRIEQVVANLISNAIKFTQKGIIELRLEVNKDQSAVTIFVTDTGSGIEPEDTQKIFERSFTKRGKSNQEGYGLGLAICKEIIDAHNGKIGAMSQVGRGTTIYINLPIIEMIQE
ncbi:AAA family ATPase [Bacillus sp. 03113]|uniref:AAA family ATPase n=1 Tax=Bacillus sp. 03113 TaxID=2578211 RepID=UPI0011416E5A|nr:AAA family ATPase [Bacillus sp. 03113]